MKKILICCVCGVAFASKILAYDFSACELKAQNTMERVGNTYGVAIKKADSKDRAVLFVYSPKAFPKGYKILKHDPFVGMYLLESKKKLEPIEIRDLTKEVLEDEMASITPKDSVSGKVQQRMQSPIDFAKLNVTTFNGSIISTICDHAFGVGIGNGNFIEKDYLDRFVKSEKIHYGDIGVRIEQGNEGVVVRVIDPFFSKNPFKYDDEILSINGQKTPNISSFNRVVFDLPKDSLAEVSLRRNGVVIEVPVIVDSRRGGMLLAEDFFGRVGINVSDDFVITKVENSAKNGFDRLKVGDRVLKVNQHSAPKGKNTIIHLLGDYPDMKQKWLISRDDFQFFIEINTKDNSVKKESLTEGLLSETTRFAL